MHLYEINTEIALLMQQLEVDEETGEILTSSEDILQQLNALDMERSRILEYLAKVVLDTRAEAAALKAEEERLAKRRRICEHREERLIEVLDRECKGWSRTCRGSTTCPVAVVDEPSVRAKVRYSVDM